MIIILSTSSTEKIEKRKKIYEQFSNLMHTKKRNKIIYINQLYRAIRSEFKCQIKQTIAEQNIRISWILEQFVWTENSLWLHFNWCWHDWTQPLTVSNNYFLSVCRLLRRFNCEPALSVIGQNRLCVTCNLFASCMHGFFGAVVVPVFSVASFHRSMQKKYIHWTGHRIKVKNEKICIDVCHKQFLIKKKEKENSTDHLFVSLV